MRSTTKRKKAKTKESTNTTMVEPFNSSHVGQVTFFISNFTSEKNWTILFIMISPVLTDQP